MKGNPRVVKEMRESNIKGNSKSNQGGLHEKRKGWKRRKQHAENGRK